MVVFCGFCYRVVVLYGTIPILFSLTISCLRGGGLLRQADLVIVKLLMEFIPAFVCVACINFFYDYN
jgi:hypothetical protein